MKSDDAARSLRILEIGSDCLFALAVPAQTEFYGTGIGLRGNLRRRFGRFGAITRAFGPVQFIRSLLKLRRGEYDLVVVHAAPFAPWHPRSFLTLLGSWNVLSPLGLFANYARRMVHLVTRYPSSRLILETASGSAGTTFSCSIFQDLFQAGAAGRSLACFLQLYLPRPPRSSVARPGEKPRAAAQARTDQLRIFLFPV